MEDSLIGKTFLVTGATSGIGLACAEILVKRGARVVGVGRSKERCYLAEQRLRTIQPDSQTEFIIADLSLQSEVRNLANSIRKTVTNLDGLLNNAGTFTYWQELTREGFETQWAVNHLAPFLLTREVLPLLQASSTARVVTVTSDSHYFGKINWEDPQLHRHYNGLRAYGNTKLANILFTAELMKQMGKKSNVRAFAADPGLVKTDIGFKGTPPLVRWIWQLRRSGGVSAAESALGIVFLLTAPAIQGSKELYWRHGLPRTSSRASRDEIASNRLWELSNQMCANHSAEVKDACYSS